MLSSDRHHFRDSEIVVKSIRVVVANVLNVVVNGHRLSRNVVVVVVAKSIHVVVANVLNVVVNRQRLSRNGRRRFSMAKKKTLYIFVILSDSFRSMHHSSDVGKIHAV